MNSCTLFPRFGATIMFHFSIRKMTVACVVTASMLLMPAESRAGRIWDCMFGPTPPSYTTYAPTYVPAYTAPTCPPVVTMPCQPCAQSCQPVSSCQSCQYAPQVASSSYYTTYYAPAPVSIYPAMTVGYAPYVGYTTYRPLLGWNAPRLVPYTTYRPVYAPVVSYGAYYSSPCTSCNSCGSPSPCGCGSAVYGSTSSGCSSCGETVSNSTVSSEPYYSSSSDASVVGNSSTSEDAKTFRDNKPIQEKVDKPVTEPVLKPIPQPETQFNSMPAPALPDPNNRRTASLPTVRQSSNVQAASYIAPSNPRPIRTNDDWQPSKD